MDTCGQKYTSQAKLFQSYVTEAFIHTHTHTHTHTHMHAGDTRDADSIPGRKDPLE